MTSQARGIAFVLDMERGWYNGGESRDPNPTLDGVTQRYYDDWRDRQNLSRRIVRLMTDAERGLIYDEYWHACKADQMPDPIGAIHFAFAFNSGSGDAARALQSALGVTVDGMIGPKTLGALGAVEAAAFAPILLLEQVRSYYDEAIRVKRLRPNMTSWMGRITRGWDLVRSLV